MAQGFLSIILYAHLPYVRHPEYEYSLEEKWFFEDLTECYIPILMCLEKIRDDRNEVWLNGSNDWTYRHLHRAAEEMVILATEHPEADDLLRRTLTQAARELLLAQSGNWPFIMNSGTMVDYALKRLRGHLVNFRAHHPTSKTGAWAAPVLLRSEGV